MQKLLLVTLSLSIVACQEKAPESTTIDQPSQLEQSPELNGYDKAPSKVKQSFERSEKPFHNYLEDKLVELDSLEEITVEGLQPKEVPVEANCIYGGELDGTIEITLDTDLIWQLDLFDENDLQVKEINSLVQPMLNAKDVSPHLLDDNTLELTYHTEYVDLQIDATVYGQGKLTGEWYICAP